MRHKLKALALLALVLSACFINTGRTQAAPGSVSVSPGLIHASISAAEPEREETIVVKNNFSAPVRLNASAHGVYNPADLGSEAEKADDPLSKAISISKTDFTLKPSQSIKLKILIKDFSSLAPGGHNAAILIKQISGDEGGEVGIQQAVSVGLYIIKEDGAKRELTLSFDELSKIAFTTPSSVNLTFSNTGNVLLIPRAVVSINSGADIYARGAVNDGSLPVSPGDNLTLSANLYKLKSSLWPSKRTLSVQYRYDGQSGVQMASQSFWYIPWQFVLVLVAIVSLLFWQRKRIAAFTKKVHKKLTKGRKKSAPNEQKSAKKDTSPKLISDITSVDESKPKSKSKKEAKKG